MTKTSSSKKPTRLPCSCRCVESQRLLPPGRERSLEFGEVCPAVLHGDDFAVEDRPIDRDVERGRDRGETLRTVEPRPRADRHPTLVETDLEAIAVVLDFMEPLSPAACAEPLSIATNAMQ